MINLKCLLLILVLSAHIPFIAISQVDNSVLINYRDTILRPLNPIKASIVITNAQNELLLIYSDSGNYETVNYLLQIGANPNYSNEEGITPLMYAADNGNYKIVQLLINKGADVNYKPYDGNSAIFAAVRANNDSIVDLLIQNKAEINIQNSKGLSPLHYAAGYGYPYITNLLINYGAKLDIPDSFGNTPVMSSVYEGAYNATELLITAGADVNVVDNLGNSPLMVAAQFNDTTLIRMLYTSGAKLDYTNRYNTNALSIAIRNHSNDAVKILVDLGEKTSDVDLKRSFYQQAYESGNDEILPFIKSKGLSTRLKPNISSIHLYSGFSTSSNDFMLDFGGGIYEPITRMLVSIGYKYRPKSSRVLEYRNSEFYQFWEKRYDIYLSLQHLIILKRIPQRYNLGIVPGLSNDFTWAYYRGLEKGTGTKWVIVPSIGLFYQKEFFTIVGKWEIANYNKQIKSFNRFNLQFLLTIPNLSNNIKNKKIGWLD
jgi:ankyrin repeat protein